MNYVLEATCKFKNARTNFALAHVESKKCIFIIGGTDAKDVIYANTIAYNYEQNKMIYRESEDLKLPLLSKPKD